MAGGATRLLYSMDYKQIVWLASYPKSGNTWVRCFLEAYVLGEVDINDLAISIPDDISYRHQVGDGSDPKTYPVDIQALTRPMSLLRLVRMYQDNKIEGVPLFVKTHNAHVVANGIELLPMSLTKSVIYLVRDPRDVVVSFSKHMGCDIDQGIKWFLDKYRVLEDNRSAKMTDFVSSWSANVSSYANADTHNVLCVRYEDLKENPVEQFTKIIQHAGLVPDVQRVRRAVEAVAISKLREQEKDKGFRESSPYAKDKFFGEGVTGKWRDVLTLPQKYKIERHCKSMLDRFYGHGYSKRSNPQNVKTHSSTGRR